MERIIGSGVTVRKTLSKVFLDQVGFAPIFTIGILSMIGLFQGQDKASLKAKLNDELVDIVVNGWKVRCHSEFYVKPNRFPHCTNTFHFFCRFGLLPNSLISTMFHLI